MRVDTARRIVERAKLDTESRWYRLIVGACATFAIVASARLFLRP